MTMVPSGDMSSANDVSLIGTGRRDLHKETRPPQLIGLPAHEHGIHTVHNQGWE